MSKSKKVRKKQIRRQSSTTSPTFSSIVKKWLEEKHPVLIFIAKFILILLLLHIVRYTSYYLDVLQPVLTKANAWIGHLMLNALGYDTVANGPAIHSQDFSMNIVHGCDATEAVMIFISIVLAFPVSGSKRIIGALTGTLLLLSVNLFRVVSLFLIGVYFPEWFEFAHIEAWQFIFIMLALIACALWIRWALYNPKSVHLAE